jgi:hypothetical protein
MVGRNQSASLISQTDIYGWVDMCAVFLPISLYSLQMLEDLQTIKGSVRPSAKFFRDMQIFAVKLNAKFAI